MFRFLKVLALACLLVTAGGVVAMAAPSKLALVIGNSNYETVSALPNPANDARLIASTLEAIGFKVDSHVNLKRTEFYDAVSNFIQRVDAASREDKVYAVVFYAGHGLQHEGENYLIPVDAKIGKPADIARDGYSVSTMLIDLERVRANLNLIILDACRNNPFIKNRAIAVEGLGIPSASMATHGSLIAFSTAPGKIAADGTGANSPYSAALAKHLKREGLKIQEVLNETGQEVAGATANEQIPWYNSSPVPDFFPAGEKRDQPPDLSNVTETPCEIAFAKALEDNSVASYETFSRACPNDPRVEAVKKNALALSDEIKWQDTQQTATVAACRLYLDTFPQGNHRVEAEECFGLHKKPGEADDAAWEEALGCAAREETGTPDMCERLTRQIACAEGYRRSQGTTGKHESEAVEAIEEFRSNLEGRNCGMVGPSGGAAVSASTDGIYTVSRGYDIQRDRNCLRSYPETRAEVKDGLMTFISDGRTWRGSIGEDGSLTINREDVDPRPKQHLIIYGPMSEAVMESGYCGTGWFRLAKVEENAPDPETTEARQKGLADGVYNATRGYTDDSRPKPNSECPGHVGPFKVRVAGSRMDFTIDRRQLRAFLDENGSIEVNGNASLVKGPRFRSEFTISGHYSDAAMYSGYCGAGFFRVER